jgi:aspartoacylase
VERWPSGLVIEVGPVPQGLVSATICRQTELAVEAACDTLAAAAAGRLHLPQGLQVHLHQASLDLPRRSDGTPLAALHPQRQHRDWQPLQCGDPLFWQPDGGGERYAPERLALNAEARWPVFINEAAYGEKGIALSLCRRERWSCERSWAEALEQLLQRSGPL